MTSSSNLKMNLSRRASAGMWCQARCPRDEPTSGRGKPTMVRWSARAKLTGPDRLAFQWPVPDH